MTAFIAAVFSVGLIILIGFIAGKTLLIELQTLSQLTVYIMAPALVVDSFYRTTVSFASSAGILLTFFLASFILYLVVKAIAHLLKWSTPMTKSLIASALFPNTGNLGLPLVTFILGTPGLERAIIYLVGSTILMFGVAPSLLKGNNISFDLSFTLKLPLFWAIILGLGLRFFAVKIPFNMDYSIQQLGLASIPLGLIILGIQLSKTSVQFGFNEILATTARLVLAPLITYAIGIAFHLQPLDLKVSVLQSAMPAAVNTVVLTTEFGGEPLYAARTIVLSTLASFVTIPLCMWLFGLI